MSYGYELMKKSCWNGSGIDKKILLIWKRDWWEEYCWNGSGIDANTAEMEARLARRIFLK